MNLHKILILSFTVLQLSCKTDLFKESNQIGVEEVENDSCENFEKNFENIFYYGTDIDYNFGFQELLIKRLGIYPIYSKTNDSSTKSELRIYMDSLIEAKNLVDTIDQLKIEAETIYKGKDIQKTIDQKYVINPVVSPTYSGGSTALNSELNIKFNSYNCSTWVEFYVWIDTTGNIESYKCIKSGGKELNELCKNRIKQMRQFTSAYYARDFSIGDVKSKNILYKVPCRINLTFKVNTNLSVFIR
jgi:hypothetical protein